MVLTLHLLLHSSGRAVFHFPWTSGEIMSGRLRLIGGTQSTQPAASRDTQRDPLPLPAGSILSTCAPFERSQFSQACIDVLAVTFGILFLVSVAASIPLAVFIMLFIRGWPVITAEELREKLLYYPETGVFIRLKTKCSHLIGLPAGHRSSIHGYNVIRIDGTLYRASRLAWLYMTGAWPSDLIDHIDGSRDNDAFANLRQATRQQNNSNKHSVHASSGFKGVFFVKRHNHYIARLVKNRRGYHLGTFNNPLEAAVAYNAGAVRHFGEFAKLNQVWDQPTGGKADRLESV
jgi:hypothetical protein